MISSILQFLQGGIQPLHIVSTGIGARVTAMVDIVLVALVFLALFRFLRRTRATNILLSFLFIAATIIIARLFNLAALNVLFTVFAALLVFAIPILFQPELRRGLERIGRISFLGKGNDEQLDIAVVRAIVDAVETLQARKVGALIVLERQTGLSEYIDTGTKIQALVEPSLLVSLFNYGSPLHDGAVIIRDDTIVAATCTLPLTESETSERLGTRHRAALGISESTDAIAIVISEEQGKISVACDGRLLSVSGPQHLSHILRKITDPKRS